MLAQYYGNLCADKCIRELVIVINYDLKRFGWEHRKSNEFCNTILKKGVSAVTVTRIVMS